MRSMSDFLQGMDIFLIYALSFLVRIVLLLYGEWQDTTMEVKFTDVDYFVFNDAAEFVSLGESPYRRATYRYSPVMAWLLLPNVYLHKAWGKLLFVLLDLLTAEFTRQILVSLQCRDKLVKFALCLWLFNPITMTVSCRGNAESVLSALVLGILHSLLQKRTVQAGILFAVSVHLKIYPVIYAFCIFLFLGGNYDKKRGEIFFTDVFCFEKHKLCGLWKKIFSVERMKFISASVLTFFLLTSLMYALYGYDFIEHAYAYHISRRDVRHNFSVYFYMLYVNTNMLLAMLCFINQFLVIFATSYINYEDPIFCFFLLTYAFVTFNKICTSQYFFWYLCFVPLLIKGLNHMYLRKLVIPTLLWFLGQALWLLPAYLLEFKGFNTFLWLWTAGCTFFIINIAIIKWLLISYRFQPIFNHNGILNNNIVKSD